MKVHTSDFKSQLKELGRELRGVITYGNTTLEEEINSITPHYEADILKSVMKQLDLELTVDIPLNTVINCQIGILVNGSYEMLNYGNYVVYNSEKQEDTNTYKITCYDKLLYSMKQNEDLGISYPISIKNYLNAVASKIGLTVASGTFYNQDLQIPSELYLGQEYTYRDILDEIAQATGSTICLNENDEIVVKYPTLTNDTIDEDYLKDINVDFGQKYGVINSIVLSRSGESDNVYLRDEESVAENGLTEVKIVDNQIMNFNNRSDYLQGLLNALNGLYYYLNDFNSTGILYYEVGDLYNVQIGENTYQCLMLNDEVNVTTGIEEIIHTDMPEQSETDYSKADKTDRRINQTYLIVDKQNQTISSVVSTVDGQNSKISSLNQRVDGLESSIQEIADITRAEENSNALVSLEDINESEPIMIKVHPTAENIGYLHPSFKELYPENTLYPKNRIINFKRTYEEEGQTIVENIPYEIPDDLLRYNSNIYDEFYLDYGSETCQITKRCEYFGGSGKNKFNPDYLMNGTRTHIISVSKDYKEKFSIIPESSSCSILLDNNFTMMINATYYLTLGSFDNISNEDITTLVTYYDVNDNVVYTRQYVGGPTKTIEYISGARYFTIKLTFNNRTSTISFGFDVLLTINNTDTSFDTYNTIIKPLAQEQIIDYPYPQILLGSGDYEVSILGYDYGYLYVRLMVQNIYTTQFYTKYETNSIIDQKANEINLGVNQTLTNYSTTNEMNSAIILKANEITSTVSNTYETKNNAQSNYSQLQQTADNISSVVSTKVGENEVISKINQSSEAVTINANKISLNGKTINMTSDNIAIASTNFNVDKNGNVTLKSGNGSSGGTTSFNITGNNRYVALKEYYNRVYLNNPTADVSASMGVGDASSGVSASIGVNGISGTDFVSMSIEDSTGSADITVAGGGKYTYIKPTGITTPKVTQTSLENQKKNFEKFNKGLETLNNIDIYKYNLKDEDNNTKKHIGFVIGDNFNYSEDVTSEKNDGVDIYSFVSLCCQAIKEQQEQIEQMKKEIDKLKGGK